MIRAFLFAVWVSFQVAAAQPPAALPSLTPKEEFERLEERMERAHDEYLENLRKRLLKADEAPGSSSLSKANEPAAAGTAKPGAVPQKGMPESPDPRVSVLARMDTLAERSAGHPDGGYVAVKTFIWSAGFRLDPAGLFERFDRATKAQTPAPDLADALALVPDIHLLDGSAEQWIGQISHVKESVENKDVQVVAAFVAGQLHLAEVERLRPPLRPAGTTDATGQKAGATGDSRDNVAGDGVESKPVGAKIAEHLASAKKTFDLVLELDPSSDYAAQAKSWIHEIEHLQPGMEAPSFSATTLSGEKVSLADLRGKVVLLDFWATWCPPCMAEAPTLAAAAERFSGGPFVILTVALDDSREMLESLLSQKKMPGIHTWDESGRDNPISELYNAQGLPTWYLIDSKGLIRARNPFGEKLAPAVEVLLQENAKPGSQSRLDD